MEKTKVLSSDQITKRHFSYAMKVCQYTSQGILFEVEGHTGGDHILLYVLKTTDEKNIIEAQEELLAQYNVSSFDVYVVPPSWFKDKDNKELSPEEKISTLRNIVNTKSFGRVGRSSVDLFTASAIVQVFDALTEQSRAKFAPWPIAKMQKFAMKFV